LFVAAVMRELVQLGVLVYVVPEAKRDIFSSDVTAGGIAFGIVGRCQYYWHRHRHHCFITRHLQIT
jgi:hypothetical protein